MAADFTFRPLLNLHDDLIFTRVGAVYHDAAKIVVRYPGVEDGIRIVWKQSSGVVDAAADVRSDNEIGWTDGPLVKPSSDQDWVGVAKLENLWTSTTYQCTSGAILLPGCFPPSH
jgi:alkaline phosphatase D